MQNTSDDLGFPVASSSCSCADSLQSSAPRPRRSGSFGITPIAGRKRIDNKLCLLVHKALVEHAPQYIADIITLTLGPFNVFIPLNGWICLHGVLD